MPQAFVTLFCEAIKAVLRTLSGLRFCSPGKRSATGGDIPPHSKKPRTFRDGVLFKRKNKKPGLSTGLSALFDAWQFPTLTWGDPTLPSALRRFTSEFGMGSGGTTALRPPGKFCFIRPLLRSDLICIRLKIFSQSAKTPSAL